MELLFIQRLQFYGVYRVIQRIQRCIRNAYLMNFQIPFCRYVLVVSENILKKIKIIYISHLDNHPDGYFFYPFLGNGCRKKVIKLKINIRK